MTLIVVLMLGAGAILIVSAFETDPATGNDVSVLQTIQDVWNDNLSLGQPAQSSGGPGQPTARGGPGGPVPALSAYGGSAGSDAYRQSLVRAYIQSQR